MKEKNWTKKWTNYKLKTHTHTRTHTYTERHTQNYTSTRTQKHNTSRRQNTVNTRKYGGVRAILSWCPTVNVRRHHRCLRFWISSSFVVVVVFVDFGKTVHTKQFPVDSNFFSRVWFLCVSLLHFFYRFTDSFLFSFFF